VASKTAKPVMFPLGRSSRSTIPLATGSLTFAKTTGIVRVFRWRATVAGVEAAKMMSGCRQAVITVFELLSKKISSGEIKDVRHALPEELRNLWPEPYVPAGMVRS
jgi:hypothetical protein